MSQEIKLQDDLESQFPSKLTEAIKNLIKNPEYLSMLVSGIGEPDRIRIMQWLKSMYDRRKYVKGWMLKKADEYFTKNSFNELNAKAVNTAVPIAVRGGKFPVDKVKEDKDLYDFLQSLDVMKGVL